MIFDESIRIPPLWIDKETLDFLNKNREEVKKKANKKVLNNKKKGMKVYKMSKAEKDEDYGF